MMPGCEAEQSALRDCIAAHTSAIGPCFASRAPMCFE
jgi:hypothetical protein